MTDTARTLAEIKTLLADNTTGSISAQDMRDAIESIVNPVAGGGFDGPPAQPQRVMLKREGAGDAGTYTGDGSFYALNIGGVPDALEDPGVLVQTGTLVSSFWGITFQPYGWFELTEGLWSISIMANWDGGNTTGYRGVFWTTADDLTGIDPFYAARGGLQVSSFPIYQLASAMPFDGRTNDSSGWMVVPRDETRRLGVIVSQDSGTPLTLGEFWLDILRVA